MLAAHLFPLIGVEHRNDGEVGLALAEEHHLLDEGIAHDRRLDIHWRDLLAVRQHDDLLQAPGDVYPPLRIDAGDITCVEPAVHAQHVRGCPWIVPVAEHHVGPLHHQRVARAQLDLDAGKRATDARRDVVVGPVAADDRACLGRAVALQHRQPQPEKNPGDVGRQRRSAGDGRPHAAAEPREDLFCDQCI